MSFILDALKKSESERHRQTGPVLMDVRIAPPRRRIPAWAWVIAAVLLVNLSVLAWVLWLPPANRGAPAMAAAPPPNAAVAPAPLSPPVALPTAPPVQVLPAPGPPAPQSPASVLPEPTLPPPVFRQAPPASAQAAPAAPPSPATQNIDVATLPKVSDMIASGMGLPSLQLSWHVYDPAPQSRYVLLNGARLREGDFTADGVRVAAIVPTGVVVEWRGRQMFLNAGH